MYKKLYKQKYMNQVFRIYKTHLSKNLLELHSKMRFMLKIYPDNGLSHMSNYIKYRHNTLTLVEVVTKWMIILFSYSKCYSKMENCIKKLFRNDFDLFCKNELHLCWCMDVIDDFMLIRFVSYIKEKPRMHKPDSKFKLLILYMTKHDICY